MEPSRVGRQSGDDRAWWLGLLLLAGATAAAFWPVLHNGWILLDDPTYVTDNPHVTTGVTGAGLRWFLTHEHGGNWHPITSYSHMLDVQLFGVNPHAHHAVGMVLHVANALLLAVLLARWTGRRNLALALAAFWALHPLRVESVAWASERKDVLSMLFFLLTLLAYTEWVRKGGLGRYLLAVLAFACGLMSKPMLVTTPFVLLLLDAWPLGRWQRQRVPQRLAEKVPFAALAVLSSVVTFHVQQATSSVARVSDISLAHRAANAAVTYWRYLAMTAWPHALIPFYPDEGISTVTMGAAVAGLVGVTVLVVAMRKRVPSLGVGWLWYLGTLVPVIGIVQVGSQAYADRYTYLPVIGILLMAAGAVASRKAERFVVGASLLVVALLGVLTFRQASLWRDNRTLFAATVQRSPGNYVAHNLLGQSLIQAGQTDAAIHEYLIAQNLAPGFKAPYMALAAALDSQRRHADAQRACAAAMKLWPNDPEPVTRMGQSLMAAGDASGAERSFRQAVALDPQAVPALRGLGFVLGTHGRVEEGLAYVRRAEQLAPGDPYVQLMLGKFLFARGAPIDDVVARFDRALKLHPGWPDAAAPRTFALSLRGMTAVELGRRADSLRAAGRTDDASAVSARAAAMGHAR